MSNEWYNIGRLRLSGIASDSISMHMRCHFWASHCEPRVRCDDPLPATPRNAHSIHHKSGSRRISEIFLSTSKNTNERNHCINSLTWSRGFVCLALTKCWLLDYRMGFTHTRLHIWRMIMFLSSEIIPLSLKALFVGQKKPLDIYVIFFHRTKRSISSMEASGINYCCGQICKYLITLSYNRLRVNVY